MQKLYVAMVGLPASGKSTLAGRIREALLGEGINAEIFNNGELRRKLAGPRSTEASFYSPQNEEGREMRQKIALANMEAARQFLAGDGTVAILDATNASRRRRRLIQATLTDYPVLFIDCVNEDPVLREACIMRKTELPEYRGYTTQAARDSFVARIHYYESIYSHVGEDEKYWLLVDTMANRIVGESALESSPYYPAIREVVVCTWVKNLYLIRHGKTEYNEEGRIGGDPMLMEAGRLQAAAMARAMEGRVIKYIFTSTRRRFLETASYLSRDRPGCQVMQFSEFDEISSGDCEGMSYTEIRRKMPEITRARNADKFNYCYPNGESYAMLMQRVQRGLRRALFLAGGAPLAIVGHQAINRILISMFKRQRTEDIPYIFVPQDHFYYIENTPRHRLIERIPYDD